MSTRQASDASPPIGSKADLVAWFAKGEKPRASWRIGTEHEKFLYHTDTFARPSYEEPRGVRAILDGLAAKFGWEPIKEGETVIALKRPDSEPLGATISLEPGGQFELSGAVLETLHDVAAETREHIRQVHAVADPLEIGMLGVGFDPLLRRDQMPTMPKRRYAVMTKYMPKVGHLGLDMMYRTSTVQVNLDFADEADMTQKLRVSLALQPIAQALFASSPFTEGKPNGFQTMRGEVWRDTDKSRTGNLPFVFEAGMGYERYVDYALDVPMYFIYRDGEYIDVAGASFRDFMRGTLPALKTDPRLAGEVTTIDDWSDHITTMFPDVRLKRYIEMRGADAGPEAHINALPAYWVGLLYDRSALDAASDLVKGWSTADRDMMRDGVPKQGLRLATPHGSVRDIARRTLEIARAGLKARAKRDARGRDEGCHLDYLDEIVASGASTSDRLLAAYNGAWGGDIRKIYAAERM